jgi:hypothetical protein
MAKVEFVIQKLKARVSAWIWNSDEVHSVPVDLGKVGRREPRSNLVHVGIFEQKVKCKMGKLTQVSWQVLLDDDDWNSDKAAFPPFDPSAQRDQPRGRTGRAPILLIVICALVTVLTALYLWQQAQAGIAQIETELHETVELEAWMAQSRAITAEVERVDLRTGQAMALVRVVDPQQPLPYREVRFYQETNGGWQRSAPDASFWGSQQRLESDFFTFDFRQRDGLTVAKAAVELDTLYRQMHELLGLPIPVNAGAGEKMHVTLAVEELPPGSFGDFDGTSLTITSPLLRPLPEHMSETDSLVESVALPLRRHLTAAAVGPLSVYSSPTPELVAGLRQWLTWETDGLLAEYRIELVRWLYANAPDGPRRVPDSYSEICQTLDFWEISFMMNSLFSCSGLLPILPPHNFTPPTRLWHLPLAEPMEMTQSFGQSYEPRLGRSLAIATVLEYAVKTYGPATIPLILQTVPARSSWDQTAPDLFGVSAEAFEAGWHAYLVDEYGLDPQILSNED